MYHFICLYHVEINTSFHQAVDSLRHDIRRIESINASASRKRQQNATVTSLKAFSTSNSIHRSTSQSSTDVAANSLSIGNDTQETHNRITSDSSRKSSISTSKLQSGSRIRRFSNM